MQLLSGLIALIESPETIIDRANNEGILLLLPENGGVKFLVLARNIEFISPLHHTASKEEEFFWKETPWEEITLSCRAILPLVIFILIIILVSSCLSRQLDTRLISLHFEAVIREGIPHIGMKDVLEREGYIANTTNRVSEVNIEEECAGKDDEPTNPGSSTEGSRGKREEMGDSCNVMNAETPHGPSLVPLGLVLALLGMIVFNYGLTFGLEALGSQV